MSNPDGRTHWETCWQDHLDCAVERCQILHRQATALAASQCKAFYGDEHGHSSCYIEDERDALKAENAQLKTLLQAWRAIAPAWPLSGHEIDNRYHLIQRTDAALAPKEPSNG